MSAVIESHFGLTEALGVGAGDVISLAGAGGKTTILYGLVTELRRRGVTVIATTTTHTQAQDSPTTAPPIVFTSEEENWLQSVRARLDRYGAVTVVSARKREDKLKGLQPEDIDPLRGMADCVIIEADGARGRSLKAPASHEPVVPEWSTATIVVARDWMCWDVLSMKRAFIVWRFSASSLGRRWVAPLWKKSLRSPSCGGTSRRFPAARVASFS